MKRKKRQQTTWKFHAAYAGGTYLKIGYVHNKRRGVREDVIRLKVKSESTEVDVQMRIDEAVLLASGLTKVAGQMLIGQLPMTKLLK